MVAAGTGPCLQASAPRPAGPAPRVTRGVAGGDRSTPRLARWRLMAKAARGPAGRATPRLMARAARGLAA